MKWRDEFLQKAEEFEMQIAMIEYGWKLYPANATEEEQDAARRAYINGGKPSWYPAEYVEDPVITEGKIRPA